MDDQDYGQFIVIDVEPTFTKINIMKERVVEQQTRKRTKSEELQLHAMALFDNILKMFGVNPDEHH